jgi:hypothetical protein
MTTLAWVANIAGARMRGQDWRVSAATVILLVYSGVALGIAEATRRRLPSTPATMARYACWLPLLYLTLCYDHHSLLPRVQLLLVLALSATIDAGGGVFAGPCLSVSLLLGFISAADMLWRSPTPAVILEKHPPRYWRSDSMLGYRPLADTTVSIACWRNRNRIYQVSCSFDRFGRRHTPEDPADTPVSHTIFMGNSCTFGENVADDQTLPAHFARLTAGIAVYNYGFIGWGPQQMLALLESGELASQVPQTRGLMVYGVIPDHVRRVNGSYSATAWGEQFPRYEIKDGTPQRVGSFAGSQPRRMACFRLLRSSPTLDYLARRMDRITGASPGGWKTLLSVVRRSSMEYRRQFEGSFVVFIWPFGDPQTRAMADSLAAYGIHVIDLASRGISPPRPEQLVPFDPHPAGSYYDLVARELVTALAPPT